MVTARLGHYCLWSPLTFWGLNRDVVSMRFHEVDRMVDQVVVAWRFRGFQLVVGKVSL